MTSMIINKVFRYIELRKVVTTCINYPSYSAGIFINDRINKEKIIEELLEMIPCVEIDKFITTKNEPTQIRFKNGSYIHIFSGVKNGYMPRYGTIIYDKCLKRQYVEEVIIPLQVKIQRNGRLLYSTKKIGF